MFKRKTVFILGAGASWHYGYPTGEDLIKKVIEKATIASHFFRQTCGQNVRPALPHRPKIVMRHELSKNGVTHLAQWEAAAKECDDLKERLQFANPLVIDYFLGWNPELSEIGRMMIAWVILECEERYFRYRFNLNRDPRTPYDKDDWYRFILSKLVSGYSDPSELLKNNVSFITFNYDTSLERCLYQGLRSYAPIRPLIPDFFAKYPVLHIYGKIHDGFPLNAAPPSMEVEPTLKTPSFEDFEYVEYHKKLNGVLDRAYDASTLIKTIHPGTKDDNKEMIKFARDIVWNAECIYVLGYGFDENNSRRIGLDQQRNPAVQTQMMFTNFGSSNRVAKLAGRLFFGDPQALLPPGPPTHIGANLFCEMSERDVYGAFEFDFDSMEER
jgi:hypothetical protein